jgi:hypothetical protein
MDAWRDKDGCALAEAASNATIDATPANLMPLTVTRAMTPPQSHNAAVERRRGHLSSAPRVHNGMTHVRRARDDV